MDLSDAAVQLLESRTGQRVSSPKQLFDRLYAELHARARRIVRARHRLDPKSPTSLVHDAFLRLEASESFDITDDQHFLTLASMVMRRMIIDRARSIRSERHGSGNIHEPIRSDHVELNRDPDELIAIDQALDCIAVKKPRAAQVGELLVFVGIGVQETAALLNVSRKTIKRDIDELAVELHLLGYGKQGTTVEFT
jgi:RNA polymerase sigma factor (TIGR02999 family)